MLAERGGVAHDVVDVVELHFQEGLQALVHSLGEGADVVLGTVPAALA